MRDAAPACDISLKIVDKENRGWVSCAADVRRAMMAALAS